jgi:hypothetical protein
MSQSDQKRFNRYFPQRPILYQAGYAIILDSPTAAILLCQLLYWHGKGKRKDGWVYKTIPEIQKETGLTRYNQETAIKKLRNLGVLRYRLAGIPRTRHFKLDLAELENVIPSLMDSHKLVYLKPPSSVVAKPPAISESTLENTTEIRQRIVDKKSYLEGRADLTRKMGRPP